MTLAGTGHVICISNFAPSRVGCQILIVTVRLPRHHRHHVGLYCFSLSRYSTYFNTILNPKQVICLEHLYLKRDVIAESR